MKYVLIVFVCILGICKETFGQDTISVFKQKALFISTGTGLMKGNLDELNQDLALEGFAPIPALLSITSVKFGHYFKKLFAEVEFQQCISDQIEAANSSVISLSASNIGLNIGYDLYNSQHVDVSVFGGVLQNFTTVTMKESNVAGQSNVSDLLSMPHRSASSIFRKGFQQLGVMVDYKPFATYEGISIGSRLAFQVQTRLNRFEAPIGPYTLIFVKFTNLKSSVQWGR
ncbi:MAG: hypothetical protein JXQ90_17610 [Cyclobacteriaceae bacterium]